MTNYLDNKKMPAFNRSGNTPPLQAWLLSANRRIGPIAGPLGISGEQLQNKLTNYTSQKDKTN